MPASWANALAPTIGLVGLHADARQLREQPRRGGELRRVDDGVEPEDLPAGAQQHDDLFERCVAGTLADAVDGALDLAGTGDEGGERVRHGQAEVVVAVDRQGDLVHALDGAQRLDQRRHLVGDDVADGVGDRDGRRSGPQPLADDVGQELSVGSGRVLEPELHVVGVLEGAPDRDHRCVEHGRAARPELAVDVQVGDRDERVDAEVGRDRERARRHVDVDGGGTGHAGDHTVPPDVPCDRRDRLGLRR